MAEPEVPAVPAAAAPGSEPGWKAFAVGACAALVVFCAALSAAMLFRYAQERTADPLNDRSLVDLRARFLANPEDDAAKQAIRQKDLVVRREFFAIQWHLNAGAWILVVSATIAVLLLNLLVISRAPAPEQDSLGGAGGVWRVTDRRRVAVGVFALTLFGLAVVSALVLDRGQSGACGASHCGNQAGKKVDDDRRP